MERHIYLALGDSITAGYDATHPDMAFVGHVSTYLRQRGLARRTMVLAQNGWTTKDVLQASSLIHASVWNQTNVLTLLIGGNDLRTLLRRILFTGPSLPPRLVDQRLQAFSYHLNLLCRSVRKHDIPHVLVATVYNPAPNYPLAVHAIESLNEIIREVTNHNGFELVDLYSEFQTHEAQYIEGYRTGRLEDLASPLRRPIHPNNLGHWQIAELMMSRLSSPAKRHRRDRTSDKR